MGYGASRLLVPTHLQAAASDSCYLLTAGHWPVRHGFGRSLVGFQSMGENDLTIQVLPAEGPMEHEIFMSLEGSI